MCGIVGMFNQATALPGDRAALEAMLASTVHRGEDSTRYQLFDGRCGIGINRLSIVDLARGQQPLRNETGDVHVVCNGEIYNHEAIRADLAPAHELLTRSDAEVIAHLYEDHGSAGVALLDGMFAFVLYDQRQGSFLAVRDPIGIKPLYYAREHQRWHLASEAKALLAAGVAPRDVTLLPPGHQLTQDGPEQYYWLAAHRSVPSLGLTRALLDHAVKKRLMADVEVGTFLSGGLDSSIITALACRHEPSVRAFTVGIDGSPDVEAAKAVAHYLGVRHHVRSFTVDEMIDALPEAIWHVESYNPSIVTGAVVTLMAARLAKSEGLKVVLCGEGADEIFAGYKAMRDLPWPRLVEASWTLMNNLHNTECKRLDRMSMAVSLEARVPFLDRDVVEYALNLPCSAKLGFRGGRRVEKLILRQAFEGLLPEQILWRQKMPFDQGSGGRHIIERVCAAVSDADLAEAQRRFPEARLASKEMLFYYRIFREHFGDMGGERVFELFGDYPVMMDAIATRTAESGS